jgi:hypothetical protein
LPGTHTECVAFERAQGILNPVFGRSIARESTAFRRAGDSLEPVPQRRASVIPRTSKLCRGTCRHARHARHDHPRLRRASAMGISHSGFVAEIPKRGKSPVGFFACFPGEIPDVRIYHVCYFPIFSDVGQDHIGFSAGLYDVVLDRLITSPHSPLSRVRPFEHPVLDLDPTSALTRLVARAIDNPEVSD